MASGGPKSSDGVSASMSSQFRDPNPDEGYGEPIDNGDKSSAETVADVGEEATEIERRHSMVQQLARQYTGHSVADASRDATLLFGNDGPYPQLDPSSEKFSARAWAKAIANVTNTEGPGYRRAGFCFENMNVFGYGAETDYQKDVGNVWLEIPSLARNVGSKIGRQRRIDILQKFDGIIEAGEMLVVLGPPGAGCTTFLKSIAGETNGLYVDDDTYPQAPQGRCNLYRRSGCPLPPAFRRRHPYLCVSCEVPTTAPRWFLAQPILGPPSRCCHGHVRHQPYCQYARRKRVRPRRFGRRAQASDDRGGDAIECAASVLG